MKELNPRDLGVGALVCIPIFLSGFINITTKPFLDYLQSLHQLQDLHFENNILMIK